MDKIYLGAFGNGSFIKPQFEIVEEDSIRIIENRFEEFPNGGTVYFYANEKDNLELIKNKLIKFRLDLNKDVSPKYEIYERNSNKYQATWENIVELDRDEIIEILTLDISIEDILNDKNKRKIKLDHKPNNKIMLQIDEYCYGPFECMSTNEEQHYTVTIFVNSEKINKYLLEELQKYVYPATFSINGRDRLQFIYNEKKLISVKPVEQIEYIDNEKLIQFLKSILTQSGAIHSVAEFKDDFLDIIENFPDYEKDELTEKKIQRITELLQTATDLRDYKIRITEEYFKNNPNAVLDKQTYLANHEELLSSMARETVQYDEKIREYTEELEKLNREALDIRLTIEQGKDELNNQQQALKKLEEKAIADKKQELDILEQSKRHELDELERKKKEAEKKYREFDSFKHLLEEDVKSMKAERDNIKADINKKILQWAEENRNADIVNLLFSELTKMSEPEKTIAYLDNVIELDDAEGICNLIQEKLAEAGRTVSKDDIYNYAISIAQNYITVFAGEPGTGKTSLCKILAKALGLYDKRFAEISVERGWTSSKDLIGYYNPLTKEIEKTQPAFSACMETLALENENDMVKAPYFVLLDEANLSPIEFYWSHFNYYYDNPEKQVVGYSDGTQYKFGKELKFLATINYDHTTEILSPRFLDRAWVISMNPVTFDSVLSSAQDETNATNNANIVSIDSLMKCFDWIHFKNKKLNPVTKERLNIIIGKMGQVGHVLSARSIRAINHYYLVAEEYMSSKEVALDYAVAQKILPLINGNGKEYGEFIKDLLAVCQDNQLEKSTTILQKIISCSKHDFYSFFSL